MSIRRNAIASGASQAYATGINLLLVPKYVHSMGAEAYGLIGFFSLLQACFSLLDLGLTPTIARETARFRGGALMALDYRRLFRALSLLFLSISIVGGGALWSVSEGIASKWLKIESLALPEVVLCVQIMALSVALRWVGGLFRGVVSGSERLAWLSGFDAIIATLRFVAVMGSMTIWGFSPKVFFHHQLAVAVCEICGLFLMTRRLLPSVQNVGGAIGWSLRPVLPLVRFSLSVMFTSMVWVLVTQTDKLILSGVLQLSEYGYFSFAVLAANGVLIAGSPIISVIMPRMARLNAEEKNDEVLELYRKATKTISVISISIAITLATCADPLVYAWSGSRESASNVAPVLRLYAIGNGFLAFGAFPYYLQYARGNMRYHLQGNVMLLTVLAPSIAAGALWFGGVGAGAVWLGVNGLYLLIWVAYVHRKLAPGLHLKWLLGDIVKIVVPALAIAVIVAQISFNTEGRISALLHSALTGLACLLTALAMSYRAHFMRAFQVAS